MDNKSDLDKEILVLRSELDFILKSEVPEVSRNVSNYIQIILQYLIGGESDRPVEFKSERANFTSTGTESIKCALNIQHNELRNIEINYKPTARHNNYIYKSREDASWLLYQVTNSSDILKTVNGFLDNLGGDKSMSHVVMSVDRILELVNSARNILLFPKKRSINELQSQKNMKIFPLVPNDLVFSFYIQGFKLMLAIYTVKGNDSTKHLLECSSVVWLNNVMVLLTVCLQTLQQLKDKLALFDQINLDSTTTTSV